MNSLYDNLFLPQVSQKPIDKKWIEGLLVGVNNYVDTHKIVVHPLYAIMIEDACTILEKDMEEIGNKITYK
jgi:hypothetical protein